MSISELCVLFTSCGPHAPFHRSKRYIESGTKHGKMHDREKKKDATGKTTPCNDRGGPPDFGTSIRLREFSRQPALSRLSLDHPPSAFASIHIRSSGFFCLSAHVGYFDPLLCISYARSRAVKSGRKAVLVSHLVDVQWSDLDLSTEFTQDQKP